MAYLLQSVAKVPLYSNTAFLTNSGRCCNTVIT